MITDAQYSGLVSACRAIAAEQCPPGEVIYSDRFVSIALADTSGIVLVTLPRDCTQPWLNVWVSLCTGWDVRAMPRISRDTNGWYIRFTPHFD